MQDLLVATKNKGKVKEFEAILQPKGFRVLSLFDYPKIPEIEETGVTFAENALIKAKAMAELFQKPAIADDSGLSVDALGGEPGVYSARYAGEAKDDNENVKKVLDKLGQVKNEDRTAHFHCAIAIASPNGQSKVFEGTCSGVITKEPIGENGFGYDPIMYIPSHQKTMAQMSAEEKNKISHRAKALEKMNEQWEMIFG
ncbi:XTP/dITP diphosphatase [Bacillus alkalicellulosilyticus]|uniref:XTP/dITP diphosphatase n=1 Tax=Alkalihalobacterium alkalicellulosilyticum TaxID=1912214 RepID=UPI000996F7A4|nr:XTP/dITP diphosphatase [Bacillus alkalicellulosilyticus]